MKVAIIDHVGIKAGMDCYDLGLYNGLKNQGCEVSVYSNFKSEQKDIYKVFGFRVKENIFSILQMMVVYRRLSRELSSNKVNQFILQGFRFSVVEWMMIKFLKKSEARLNLIVHDPESLVGVSQSKKWKSKIVRLCETIVVHNEFSAGELMKELNADEIRKIHVIPHGHFIDTAVTATDTSAFISRSLLDKGKKHLLFFGHIKKTKGLDLLLKALVHTNQDIHLIIAGRMRKHSFDEYKALIDEFKLHHRIKLFPGYISPELRNELFQVADAIVLPYRKIFQSGVMLIALSYGKVVIASDLLPNREILSDGQNGFLFKSEDVGSLSSAIDKAMGNEALRKEVATAGRRYVESKHDWNLIAAQWIKLFNK